MRANVRDLAAGAFFVLIGIGFCVNAMRNLSIGTAVQMGPGYFPIVLGVLLALLGLGIVLQAFGSEPSPIEGVSWRGVILIGLSPIIFGGTIQALGLVPALALSTLTASLSSRRAGLGFALLISAGLTIFCVAVFVYGLGLPIQLFGSALTAWIR